MTNTTEFPATAQTTAARLRRERDAWVPIPPARIADPARTSNRRGTPAPRKIRTVL